ncbi:hypothetical protein TNCV_1662421 [Trichonephila clavipes]|nr:hypothetical protein TNCV_1662421 [Trichonephila clavipes]
MKELVSHFSDLLDCPTVSYEEFVAVDDDDVCTVQIMANESILELFRAKKISDTDSDCENEMNNAASVPTASWKVCAVI